MILALPMVLLFGCAEQPASQKTPANENPQVTEVQQPTPDTARKEVQATADGFAKNPFLENRKWVLIKLKDMRVNVSASQNPAHIILEPATSKFSGSGSCNRIFGSYEIPGGDRLKFSGMGATKMACPDMTTEDAFLQVLTATERFKVNDMELMLYGKEDIPLAILALN